MDDHHSKSVASGSKFLAMSEKPLAKVDGELNKKMVHMIAKKMYAHKYPNCEATSWDVERGDRCYRIVCTFPRVVTFDMNMDILPIIGIAPNQVRFSIQVESDETLFVVTYTELGVEKPITPTSIENEKTLFSIPGFSSNILLNTNKKRKF
jgi:hypothetical protein